MDTLLLSELKSTIERRAQIISMPNIFRLLQINSKFTSDQILETIITQSLRFFEYYEPLIIHIRTLISFDLNYNGYKFIDNTDLYNIDGTGQIQDYQVEMIPNAIIGLSRASNGIGGWAPYNYIRIFNYDRPTLYKFGLSSGVYNVKGIFNRPIKIKFDSSNNFTSDSYIMYLDGKTGGVTYKMFLDQLMMDIFTYIINMKENMVMTNLPIEIFNSCEKESTRLKEQLDLFYKESLTSGQLLI